MAFSKDDTEALYQHTIRPVLRRLGVTPVIISRRQSNTDLNIQIMEQLRRSDLCVADLTYARPSVYFEAGFAQREVPVIYTVRRDHLSGGQPEDLRVHFDLSMRPIVVWNSPRDRGFARRLEQRMRATALSDWHRKRKRDVRLSKEREAFSAIPLSQRSGCC